MAKRRSFNRSTGTRRYKRLFVVATEGQLTEPAYFSLLNDAVVFSHVRLANAGNDSAPKHVLRRMEAELAKASMRDGDKAWLVLDKDRWTHEQLTKVFAWTQGHSWRGLALSNPKFEYWLLLHFEDGHGVASSADCTRRLARHLPNYDKGIRPGLLSLEQVRSAVRRAQQRDKPPCLDWPRDLGQTTVYRLVDGILNASGNE